MVKVLADVEAMMLTMDGHAEGERNAEGHDLVCAAASILIYTLAASVQKVMARHRHGDKVVYCAEEGYATFGVDAPGGMGSDIRARYEMALDGLRLLQGKYPKCIRITYAPRDLHSTKGMVS